MIDAREVKAGMPVITAQAEPFAIVEALVNTDVIKLKPDMSGCAHMIPVSWVVSTQGGVIKVSRTLMQVKQDWASQS